MRMSTHIFLYFIYRYTHTHTQEPGTLQPADTSKLLLQQFSDSSTKRDDNPHMDATYRARNVFKVACPVIGGLYKKGALIPDELGRISNYQLTEILQKVLANSVEFSNFQAFGIAGFNHSDINQFVRDRDPPQSDT